MAAVVESVVEKVAVTDDLSSLSINNALENALPECEQCLQKLHSLPAVEHEKRLRNIKGRFGKDERTKGDNLHRLPDKSHHLHCDTSCG